MANAVKTVRLRVHVTCGIYGSMNTENTEYPWSRQRAESVS